jgi:7,8-dihydropterin-6-yl-methyl-4-(beta-D-ribofuranosyl)aminobenzene 5'-phosphate synthase
MGVAIPEQALILQTAEGLVVITGCAHPGILQMIEKSREIGKGPVHLVMGGFHLFGASRQQVREILSQFRDLGVVKVSPCHCAGTEVIEMFQESYGQDYIQCGVGQVIHLKR